MPNWRGCARSSQHPKRRPSGRELKQRNINARVFLLRSAQEKSRKIGVFGNSSPPKRMPHGRLFPRNWHSCKPPRPRRQLLCRRWQTRRPRRQRQLISTKWRPGPLSTSSCGIVDGKLTVRHCATPWVHVRSKTAQWRSLSGRLRTARPIMLFSWICNAWRSPRPSVAARMCPLRSTRPRGTRRASRRRSRSRRLAAPGASSACRLCFRRTAGPISSKSRPRAGFGFATCVGRQTTGARSWTGSHPKASGNVLKSIAMRRRRR